MSTTRASLIRSAGLAALLLGAEVATAAREARVYVVARDDRAGAPPERQALAAEFDAQLRAELRRRGAQVMEQSAQAGAIVLRPTLDIVPHGLTLTLVGVRARDHRLLGAISVKAAGSNRQAMLRAMVTRAGDEADQLN